jgi:superfamily II DNA or RNA helicase
MHRSPRPYQLKLVDDARALLRELRPKIQGRKPRIVLRSACGSGKCLGIDTPVLMFDGTIKPVQDVVVGDLLMGPDNNPRRVLSLARGRENMYRIIPKKGDPYTVNESHILSLRIQPSIHAKKPEGTSRIVNMSVRDVLSQNKNFLATHRGWRAPADFGDEDIGIDPYFVGHWIGDGHSTVPAITTSFQEIREYLYEFAAGYGIVPRMVWNSENSDIIHLTNRRGHSTTNPISQTLRRLGVMPVKCIPMSIKRMSREGRLAFLAGYLDADGHLAKGSGFEFCSVSKDIAEGVTFIARSLGFACYFNEVQKKCCNNGKVGTYYRGYISGDLSCLPTKIAKNKPRPRLINKDVLTVGIRIEPLGEGDYYGFEIDGDHLFMLGDFTVTHNTFMAAMMSKSAIEKGGTVAFLCHRSFLLDQTSQTFNDAGMGHSFLAAGKWLNKWDNCHIGMIGSMKSRQGKIKPPSICFIDEASHCVAKTWRDVIEAWPETTFILLTATPSFRTDGKGLEELADGIVHGPSEAELIRQGALSDYVWYAPSRPDLSGVHTRMGDYVNSEIEAEMSKAVIVGNIVDSYRKYANGTRAIYFAPSIKLSKQYSQAFTDAGIPAVHIDADSTDWERQSAARRMADGEIKIICNMGIATMGYDLAAQAGRDVTIETVGLCRPTKSFPLLVQMAMRAMRAKRHPGIILDHAGSLDEHKWLPDDEVEWTLSGAKRKHVSELSGECNNCGAQLRRAAVVCIACGASVEKKERKTAERVDIEHVDGELVQIDREAHRRAAAMEQGQARTLEDLIALGKKRGYKNAAGWAAKIYTARKMKGRAA